jgi:hypothetical protein
MIDAGKKFCQSLPRNIYMEVLNLPWLFDLEQLFLNLPAILYFTGLPALLISLFRNFPLL